MFLVSFFLQTKIDWKINKIRFVENDTILFNDLIWERAKVILNDLSVALKNFLSL